MLSSGPCIQVLLKFYSGPWKVVLKFPSNPKKLYSSSTKVLLRALRRRPWRSWCVRLPRPCQCRGRQRWRRWWSWTQCWWASMNAFKIARSNNWVRPVRTFFLQCDHLQAGVTKTPLQKSRKRRGATRRKWNLEKSLTRRKQQLLDMRPIRLLRWNSSKKLDLEMWPIKVDGSFEETHLNQNLMLE